MSKFVRIASVMFQTSAPEAGGKHKDIILNETRTTLESLEGFGFDLVVLSEGVESYGQSVKDAESFDAPGDFLSLYSEMAVKLKCHIAGSAKIAESGKVYNSIVYVAPNGEFIGRYHKMNLTIGEIEMGLASGDQAVAVDSSIGRLSGAICFDLNFHDVQTATAALKPDIITFASMYHGGLMQAYWAYQARAFLVSALPFHGGGILDPLGNAMALTDCYNQVAVATVNLDRQMVHLDFNREKFPEIKRKYGDEVTIEIPPNIGPALINSNTDKRSAMDIVKEFDLELIDDYFKRATEANAANR